MKLILLHVVFCLQGSKAIGTESSFSFMLSKSEISLHRHLENECHFMIKLYFGYSKYGS